MCEFINALSMTAGRITFRNRDFSRQPKNNPIEQDDYPTDILNAKVLIVDDQS